MEECCFFKGTNLSESHHTMCAIAETRCLFFILFFFFQNFLRTRFIFHSLPPPPPAPFQPHTFSAISFFSRLITVKDMGLRLPWQPAQLWLGETAAWWEVRRMQLMPHNVPRLISSPWQLLGPVGCGGFEKMCIRQRDVCCWGALPWCSLCSQHTVIVLPFSTRLSAGACLKSDSLSCCQGYNLSDTV